VTQLITKGCRKIACFAITPLHLSTIEDRINGYKAALTKSGLKKKDQLLRTIRFENISEDVEKWLNEFASAGIELDAIFALNNHIAVAVLCALKKKRLEKFSHVKIACFDDIATFDLVDKKVISVSQPIEEIGKSSSELLLNLIAGSSKGKSSVVLPTKLIVR
jgi:DNA-binding LacI/PurR family transcriptional regulator